MVASVSVDIQVASGAGSVPARAEIRSWLSDVASEAGLTHDCEVSVRIVGEPEGRALNERYRAVDHATNVLSFPTDHGEIARPLPGCPLSLGDIVICGPVVMREAAEQQKSISAHWAHMLVHGMLHLLGHDHEDDADAEKMEAIETRILLQRGVTDPYSDRGTR